MPRPLAPFLVATLVGCAHSIQPAVPTANTSAAYESCVDEVIEAAHAMRPSSSTSDGVHTHDAELEDFSPAHLHARVKELDGFIARLQRIDPNGLSFDQQIDRQALLADQQAERFNLTELRDYQRNPMIYVRIAGGSVNGLMVRNFAPPEERLNAIIRRLEKIPAFLEQARRNLRNPPPEFVELAIQMSRGTAGFFSDDVSRWAEKASDNNPRLMKHFRDANAQVIEVFKAFTLWLETDLKRQAHGTFALGPEKFRTKLRLEEGIDLPVDALLARGQAQLDKDHRDFVETAKRIDPKKTPTEVMASLSDDHPSAEGLLPFVRASLESVRSFILEKNLLTLPSNDRPTVEETPPFARNGSFASMDTPGAFETQSREAFYFVTPAETDWTPQHTEEHLRLFNRPVVSLITIHEVFPGHFVQLLFSPTLRGKVRKFVQTNSNTEGWAHYAEQMMVDEGFGQGDPKIRLAQLSEALIRDCRYVTGIKIHTQGLPLESGVKLFENECFVLPANARAEAMRGTYDATYLYYTYGKLEIQQLARDYQAAKGGTLRDFHNAFLAAGQLPLSQIRQLLLH